MMCSTDGQMSTIPSLLWEKPQLMNVITFMQVNPIFQLLPSFVYLLSPPLYLYPSHFLPQSMHRNTAVACSPLSLLSLHMCLASCCHWPVRGRNSLVSSDLPPTSNWQTRWPCYSLEHPSSNMSICFNYHMALNSPLCHLYIHVHVPQLTCMFIHVLSIDIVCVCRNGRPSITFSCEMPEFYFQRCIYIFSCWVSNQYIL